MDAPPRRISWITPPPEICTLCKEPLGPPSETSSWNGAPAHRDCVRIHLMQRDPAFHESGDGEESTEESGDMTDGFLPRDDDDADLD
jgi:hypothetical protein